MTWPITVVVKYQNNRIKEKKTTYNIMLNNLLHKLFLCIKKLAKMLKYLPKICSHNNVQHAGLKHETKTAYSSELLILISDFLNLFCCHNLNPKDSDS